MPLSDISALISDNALLMGAILLIITTATGFSSFVEDRQLPEQLGEWPTQALATIDARALERGPVWTRSYAQACEREDLPAQRCLDQSLWKFDALLGLLIEDSSHAPHVWAEIDELLRDSPACLATREPSFQAPALGLASGSALARMRLLLNLEGGKGPLLPATITALELDPLPAMAIFRQLGPRIEP